MIYNKNGNLGIFSAIGLGCWNFGGQWNKVSEDDAIQIIRYAIDNGINYVDVAESYGIPDGECEILLGKALQDGYRDKVFIISKVGWYGRRTEDHFYANPSIYDKILRKIFNRLNHYKSVDLEKRTPELIRLCGHACCGRLQTSYIDLLLCHDGNAKDIKEFVSGFEILKKEGFIKNYGISTDRLDILKEFYERSNGVCAAVECDYSLLNTKAENGIFKFCKENNIAIFTRGTLARGLLSGRYTTSTVFQEPSRLVWNEGGKSRSTYLKYLSKIEKIKELIGNEKLTEVSYRYAFSQPEHPSVIVGCTSLDQLKQNIDIASHYLSPELIEQLRNNL